MNHPEFLRVYDSQSEAAQQAFQAFLDHTDQKRNVRAWLERRIAKLPRRGTFIDAGAGTGQLTRWIAAHFERTIAIEPSPFLREQCRKNFPDCELLGDFISDARPGAKADLVVCSHVLYFIDHAQWMSTLETLVDWLDVGGVTIVMLRSPDTELSHLEKHLHGAYFDLAPLAAEFEQQHGSEFTVQIESVPASFTPPDERTARTVIEYMLSDRRADEPIRWRDVDDYLAGQVGELAGARFSCDQDCLMISRRD